MGAKAKTQDLERAKALYFESLEYGGPSHEFWYDAREEYDRCGVTSADEKAWREEYVALWLGRLSVEDFTALHRLKHFVGARALPDLIRVAWQGDSLARLNYAEFICDMVESNALSPGVLSQGYPVVKQLGQAVATEPIQLSPAHRRIVEARLPASGFSTPEEYLHDAGARLINRLRNLPVRIVIHAILFLWLAVTIVVAFPFFYLAEFIGKRRR